MSFSAKERCRAGLAQLKAIANVLSPVERHSEPVNFERVNDELARFILWIGNIGALHPPESPLSLEARLREARDVLTHVLELLEELTDVASDLSEIVSGQRNARFASPIGLDESAGNDEEATHTHEELNEEIELIEEIGECITRLFRVSSLIRKAAPTDLFAKALSRNHYQFVDQFDIAHVGEKFPKLATAEFGFLRRRLGRAITQRRHYLKYIQDHRNKLDNASESEVTPENALPIVVNETAAHNTLQSAKSVLDSSSRPSTFITKASTLVPGRINVQMLTTGEDSDLENDAVSYTTVSRTVDGDHEASTISRIPKLEELKKAGQKDVECPFCFRFQKFKSERAWRRHVFKDLRTYLCTFPDCDATYFGDINEWFSHELQVHRVDYSCLLCKSKKYDTKDRYVEHLRHQHAEMLDDGDEEQVIEIARKSLTQIRAQDCPCCYDWVNRLKERYSPDALQATPGNVIVVLPSDFKRHLASHLEQLAMFAIPIGSQIEEDVGSNVAIEEEAEAASAPSVATTLTFNSAGTMAREDDQAEQREADERAERAAQLRLQQSQPGYWDPRGGDRYPIPHENPAFGRRNSITGRRPSISAPVVPPTGLARTNSHNDHESERAGAIEALKESTTVGPKTDVMDSDWEFLFESSLDEPPENLSLGSSVLHFPIYYKEPLGHNLALFCNSVENAYQAEVRIDTTLEELQVTVRVTQKSLETACGVLTSAVENAIFDAAPIPGASDEKILSVPSEFLEALVNDGNHQLERIKNRFMVDITFVTPDAQSGHFVEVRVEGSTHVNAAKVAIQELIEQVQAWEGPHSGFVYTITGGEIPSASPTGDGTMEIPYENFQSLIGIGAMHLSIIRDRYDVDIRFEPMSLPNIHVKVRVFGRTHEKSGVMRAKEELHKLLWEINEKFEPWREKYNEREPVDQRLEETVTVTVAAGYFERSVLTRLQIDRKLSPFNVRVTYPANESPREVAISIQGARVDVDNAREALMALLGPLSLEYSATVDRPDLPFTVRAIHPYNAVDQFGLTFREDQLIDVTDILGNRFDEYRGHYTDGFGIKHDGLFPKDYVVRYGASNLESAKKGTLPYEADDSTNDIDSPELQRPSDLPNSPIKSDTGKDGEALPLRTDTEVMKPGGSSVDATLDTDAVPRTILRRSSQAARPDSTDLEWRSQAPIRPRAGPLPARRYGRNDFDPLAVTRQEIVIEQGVKVVKEVRRRIDPPNRREGRERFGGLPIRNWKIPTSRAPPDGTVDPAAEGRPSSQKSVTGATSKHPPASAVGDASTKNPLLPAETRPVPSPSPPAPRDAGEMHTPPSTDQVRVPVRDFENELAKVPQDDLDRRLDDFMNRAEHSRQVREFEALQKE